MAENTEVIATPGATEAPPSAPNADQSSDLSIEEIADAVAARLELYRADQSQADKAVAALRKELLPYLEDGRRTSEEVKQTTALVRALARGDVLSEEQMESMDNARKEAARIQTLEADNARLVAEKADLEKSGLKCFMAEKDIHVATEWQDSIRAALIGSRRVLVLLTPRSINRPWVLMETGAAWALGKALIPALSHVAANELLDPIRRHQARVIETTAQRQSLVNELTGT